MTAAERALVEHYNKYEAEEKRGGGDWVWDFLMIYSHITTEISGGEFGEPSAGGEPDGGDEAQAVSPINDATFETGDAVLSHIFDDYGFGAVADVVTPGDFPLSPAILPALHVYFLFRALFQTWTRWFRVRRVFTGRFDSSTGCEWPRQAPVSMLFCSLFFLFVPIPFLPSRCQR